MLFARVHRKISGSSRAPLNASIKPFINSVTSGLAGEIACIGQYQYTYNMVCAKNDVFDEYCKWFFEITEYMESMGDRVTDIRDTRALSYVAEVLTNLYFMSNKPGLKIYHAEKEIYV